MRTKQKLYPHAAWCEGCSSSPENDLPPVECATHPWEGRQLIAHGVVDRPQQIDVAVYRNLDPKFRSPAMDDRDTCTISFGVAAAWEDVGELRWTELTVGEARELVDRLTHLIEMADADAAVVTPASYKAAPAGAPSTAPGP